MKHFSQSVTQSVSPSPAGPAAPLSYVVEMGPLLASRSKATAGRAEPAILQLQKGLRLGGRVHGRRTLKPATVP